MNYNLIVPEILSTKEAFCSVFEPHTGLHVAWELEDGKVIAFEWIPENYPQGGSTSSTTTRTG